MTMILPKDFTPVEVTQPSFPLGGIPEGTDAFVLMDLLTQKSLEDHAFVFVAHDEGAMRHLQEELQYLMPDLSILTFTAWDCLPYDRVSPRKDIIAERIKTLGILATSRATSKDRCLVLTTPSALLQKIPPPDTLSKDHIHLSPGQSCSLETLAQLLATAQYHRVSTVREPGEFAIRGGIVDIFPPSEQNPTRIDFFGDEIESMRAFDPLTQRSLEPQGGLTLGATGELSLTPEGIERFRTSYRELFQSDIRQDLLYQDISEGRSHPGVEHWLPLFYSHLVPLTSYLHNPKLVLSVGLQEAFTHRLDQVLDHYQARVDGLGKNIDPALRYNPLPPHYLYLTRGDLEALFNSHPPLWTSPFKTAEGPEAALKILLPLQGNGARPELLKAFLKDTLSKGKRIHVACQSDGSRHQFISQLQDLGFLKVESVYTWADSLKGSGKHAFFHVLPLHQGFETDAHVVITEREIYGEIQRKVPKKARRSDLFIAEASALDVGDYVVHEEHGIGQFDGLYTLQVNGIPHDCVRLLYGGGDKLFLPVENIELISRYGGEESNAVLDRLGAVAWQARRAKVKKRLEEIAEHLIQLAAERHIRDAETFLPDQSLYGEFTHRFPFTETDDQLRAIEDVLGDLAAGKPMDRLVCGDVGFGKTEVALRAAFVVAACGKQVAIVAPTTLLARQHYLNFTRRFEGFHLGIGQLSRLVTGKEATQTKEDLKKGDIDIVIGTHALLAESIGFKDLGLVIVDEEQHFGVKQKEKLKALQKDTHVLTLTATPIPRTLQMALTGVRDMSIIATPPVDRLTIRTFITPFDPVTVEEAIHRELNRGGQIFYVCPRLKDLDDVLNNLIKINPQFRLAVAHGQMAARDLEKVMDDFAAHKYDILLSTNIIESGIDLPTVNTLFVHRSDMFGLAQLYQLRGRIGRGKLRAYAYLTIPPHHLLSKNALRRLEVMQTLDTLGAGFQLASHDMDIRGAGNLLGQEQSGHVREVGVELYQHMLEEAVEKANYAREHHCAQSPQEESWSPQLNVGVPVLIPEDYVADLSVRLDLYRRLAQMTQEDEILEIGREMVDRFGPYPSEVDNLVRVMSLKQAAKKAGVARVESGDKGVVLRFHKDQFPHPDRLITYIHDQRGLAKLRPDHSVFFSRSWLSVQERFQGTQKILLELQTLL